MVIPLLLATPLTVLAQSINIDLGSPDDPAPDPGYRAAGLPGVWNKFDALTTNFEYPLVGLDGLAIPATVDQFGGTEIQKAPLGNPGDPTGNDAIFMRDALITHSPIENCLFFDALQPGTYEVLTYAWMPIRPAVLNIVRIDNNPTQTLVGGDWPGAQLENTTYARHFVDVGGSGFLGSHSGVPGGGDFEIGAALNGLQIRKLEPEPPLFPESSQLAWLASLDALRYDVVQGDLNTLRQTNGNFALSVEACVANDVVETHAAYPPGPASGEGQWFLVRGVTVLGNATYNAPGNSQVGNRDSLNFALASCP